MARPKKAIDADMVRKLAAIDCTIAEIAATLDCSRDTLERRFRDVIDQGREQGKVSLRRRQFELASSGNATMLIWLGKQRLGQRDAQDTNVNVTQRPGLLDPVEQRAAILRVLSN
jgi:AraC-like DNA-binding protein